MSKDMILRKICFILCIITFICGVYLVRCEADSVCDSFFCSDMTAEVSRGTRVISINSVNAFIKSDRGLFEKDSIKKEQIKHIQPKSTVLFRFFAIILLLSSVLLAFKLFLSPECCKNVQRASLGIVRFIHKKDGSK